MTNNKFIYDYNNLLSDTIGTDNGIKKEDIFNLKNKIDLVFDVVFEKPSLAQKAVFDILETVELDKIKAVAADVRARCDNFVVLGIGGSALGSLALFDALAHPNYNNMSKEERGGPRFFVKDSIAPESFLGLINNIDLSQTIFCVVSKSGKTTETMTQFFYARQLCEQKFGAAWKEHFVVLTDNTDNYLNKYATDNNLVKLYIPENLGGRYSVLSAVGLLPGAVLGFDIDKIIAGAKIMLECGKQKNIWQNAPLLSAAFNYLNYKNGKSMSVLVPYSDSLSAFDDWFCQLWGESIGRNRDADGADLFDNNRIGQTPIQVTGPSVQHSQFQLYLEGPDDKTFTFLGIQKFKIDADLPLELNKLFGQEVCENRTFGDLLNIERIASTLALNKYKKPSETITIEVVDECSIGKLFMFFILKMCFTGALLNINPFGQPAVESIKREVANILKQNANLSADNKINV